MMGKCKRKKNRKITFGTSFSHLHQRVREARIVRRVLERPSFPFSFHLVFTIFLPPSSTSPFLRFFVSLFFSFFFPPSQRVRLIRAVGFFYIFRFYVSRFVGGSPRASASFTKKGARREARGEERKCNAGSCPTSCRICDTATSIAREFLLFSH